jgi:hypothetical protein
MRLKSHSLLIHTAVAVAGLWGCTLSAYAECQSKSPPRTVVKVAPYGGAIAGDAQNQLSRFLEILRDKARLWKADVAALASEAPFLTKFTLSLDQTEVMKGQPITADQAYNFWRDVPNTLQVLYGAIFDSQGQYTVQSSMHLGDVEQKNTQTVVQVTLLLQGSESGTVNDSHSLIIYYALGLQALQLQCPSSVISTLLSRANEKASDLLGRKLAANERERVVQIKTSIETILSKLK